MNYLSVHDVVKVAIGSSDYRAPSDPTQDFTTTDVELTMGDGTQTVIHIFWSRKTGEQAITVLDGKRAPMVGDEIVCHSMPEDEMEITRRAALSRGQP